jgi:hypothetical protein
LIGYDEVTSIDLNEQYVVVAMANANDGKGGIKVFTITGNDIELVYEL